MGFKSDEIDLEAVLLCDLSELINVDRKITLISRVCSMFGNYWQRLGNLIVQWMRAELKFGLSSIAKAFSATLAPTFCLDKLETWY